MVGLITMLLLEGKLMERFDRQLNEIHLKVRIIVIVIGVYVDALSCSAF